MIQKISRRFGTALARELTLDDEQAEVFAYGFEIILGSLIKVVLIFLSSYLLGIYMTTLAGAFTFIFFRILSGGVHLNNYLPCLIVGTAIFLVIGKLAELSLSLNFLKILIIIIGIIVFLFCLKLAPVENPNKKLTTGQKEKFKVLSSVFVLCWICLMYFLVNITGEKYLNLILASSLALLIQGVTLTPQAYKLVNRLEIFLDFINGRR